MPLRAGLLRGRCQRILATLWSVSVVSLLVTTLFSATETEAPYPKTNLTSFLKSWQTKTANPGLICQLIPEWVGTAKRVYLRGGEDIYKDEEPNNIRFSHLLVHKDPEGKTNLTILRGRITEQGKLGSYSGEAPIFMKNLPSVKAIAEAKNGDELVRLLGPRQGGSSGWGDGSRMHWSVGGAWFRQEGKERLRYLGVFAHVSSSDKNSPADIDILTVTEGIFRPANAESDLEKQQFKSGAEVNAAYEAKRKESRAKYPFPLRSLVEARETPDDSDLTAYKRALNEIRRNPSPELFRQFAQWMHEGTLQIRGMLEGILFDRHLKLDPWAEPQRKIALRALANALPDVKTNRDLDQPNPNQNSDPFEHTPDAAISAFHSYSHLTHSLQRTQRPSAIASKLVSEENRIRKTENRQRPGSSSLSTSNHQPPGGDHGRVTHRR